MAANWANESKVFKIGLMILTSGEVEVNDETTLSAEAAKTPVTFLFGLVSGSTPYTASAVSSLVNCANKAVCAWCKDSSNSFNIKSTTSPSSIRTESLAKMSDVVSVSVRMIVFVINSKITRINSCSSWPPYSATFCKILPIKDHPSYLYLKIAASKFWSAVGINLPLVDGGK
ncbi:hypothetical protein WICPIJ_000134 [Wickerhamomyces pijperi]|uniref:Uncharacterized protein n=1 Tax=Wickerhamomyces pijperi TaxID=599730 RepID=A0A9P8QHN8_WICPI|nr:hypothetical protein WICPIJ_000134 [Wickerhamomyces pijperi]